MPELTRPDGAVIHYEERGSGVAVLALAPGGIAGRIEAWADEALDPWAAFSKVYRVIAMDSRYGGGSRAPLAPFSYEQALGDQLAVMDVLGVDRAHVIAAGFGCAHALRLLYDAPARVLSAALLEPVGLDGTNTMDPFYNLFSETIRVARADGLEGVLAAAMANPDFDANPAAGPWAQRLHDDPGFRGALQSLGRETYIALVVDFRDGVWPWYQPCFAINDVALQRIRTPLLVAPGDDPLRPAGIAETICSRAPNARPLPLASGGGVSLELGASIRQFFEANATSTAA